MIFKNSSKTIATNNISAIIYISSFIWLITYFGEVSMIMLAATPSVLLMAVDSIIYRITVTDEYIEEYRFFRKKRVLYKDIGLVYKEQIKIGKEVLVIEPRGVGGNFAEVYLYQIKNGEALINEISRHEKNEERYGPFKSAKRNGYQNVNGYVSLKLYGKCTIIAVIIISVLMITGLLTYLVNPV